MPDEPLPQMRSIAAGGVVGDVHRLCISPELPNPTIVFSELTHSKRHLALRPGPYDSAEPAAFGLRPRLRSPRTGRMSAAVTQLRTRKRQTQPSSVACRASRQARKFCPHANRGVRQAHSRANPDKVKSWDRPKVRAKLLSAPSGEKSIRRGEFCPRRPSHPNASSPR